jgi:peptidyl-prolyl cis-trans isomerase D
MLQVFRNFFKSKLGVGFTLAFLVVIAFAFASGDVANTGMFGGVSGGDRVAVVNDQGIDANDLNEAVRTALDNARRENPTLTMEAFLAQDGLTRTLDNLIARSALSVMADEYGLRIGQRLVDSEITQNPNLRGPDGNFSEETYRTALRQLNVSEDAFRDDIRMGLLAQQVLAPVQVLPQMPRSIALRYAQLGLETRTGTIAALPASAFAPAGDPTDAQINAYYAENRSDYIRPERRVIRYAVFGEDAFGNLPAPTDAQIQARYQRDAVQYAASESRRFTQLIVTTRAAAQAIIAEVNGGATLEAAARSKGLSTTAVALTTKADFTTATSAAVANAAFAASQGQLSAPAQGGIGWYVLRVDEVSRQSARTIAQVRAEISTALAAEQKREALNEATARIDDEFSEGKSLADIARELNLEVRTTRPLTAAGQVYGTPEAAPAELAPVLATAFEMEEAQPQLAETVAGEQFMVFDVSQITASAAAPLVEIRDRVALAWRQAEGMKAAGAATTRIMQRLSQGQTLAAAVAAERKQLPPVDSLTISRPDMERNRRVTRPLALFFSMAKGTTKTLEVAEQGAWFIISLTGIEAPAVPADSPIASSARTQLAGLLPDEYAQQFVAAVRNQAEVEINQPAVDAVGVAIGGSGN